MSHLMGHMGLESSATGIMIGTALGLILQLIPLVSASLISHANVVLLGMLLLACIDAEEWHYRRLGAQPEV